MFYYRIYHDVPLNGILQWYIMMHHINIYINIIVCHGNLYINTIVYHGNRYVITMVHMVICTLIRQGILYINIMLMS